MTTQTTGKLKSVLNGWQPHTVATYARLSELGVSNGLAREYVRSGWMERLGTGAFKRPNDTVTWQGAVHSLQNQLRLNVHVGALTALAAKGLSQYLRPERETVFLFSPPNVALPAWFKGHDWGASIRHTQTKLLPSDVGIHEDAFGSLALRMSTPERAILESLHLAPDEVDLVECFDVLQGLMNLRPTLMQKLLVECNSIKVRRLFLFMADKAGLPVLKHLDLDKIFLGSGDRSIVSHGAYDAKYRLTLPKELIHNV